MTSHFAGEFDLVTWFLAAINQHKEPSIPSTRIFDNCGAYHCHEWNAIVFYGCVVCGNGRKSRRHTVSGFWFLVSNFWFLALAAVAKGAAQHRFSIDRAASMAQRFIGSAIRIMLSGINNSELMFHVALRMAHQLRCMFHDSWWNLLWIIDELIVFEFSGHVSCFMDSIHLSGRTSFS